MKFLALVLSTAATAFTAPAPVTFDWFEYTGRDQSFETALPKDHFRNPILPGFYPDPSICRAGDDYYLVTSSFAYFPGIPIFHSRDLVNWRQLGHALDRPAQLKLDGLGVSRGLFAPAISYHQSTFYLVCTLVDGGGNFFVTAKNPAGPWSDPVWLRGVDGIDPAFFFDADGRAWLVNNGPPPENKSRYDGHRAIWLQEFDVKTQQLTGPRTIIVNGGVDLAQKPIWIEAPHIFRRGEWYYLICAEGGTGENHSEVVFRSKRVEGPWEPAKQNPILTQRDLPANRPAPITSTGHADFVETAKGEWWSVFLGCRPYEPGFYNTGREAFLLPVSWTNDAWPTILRPGETVPAIIAAPNLPADRSPALPLNGNFTWRDEFDASTLSLAWQFLRTPRETWWSLDEPRGVLTLRPRSVSLRDRGNPTFLARRQQHLSFRAATSLRLGDDRGVAAGLAAFQSETHHFFLGVRRRESGHEVFCERVAAKKPSDATETIARNDLPLGSARQIELCIEGDGRNYTFSYTVDGGERRVLVANVDGTILSTRVAGGFVGTMLGLHARLE
jgi:xylan 1,4-beta-xylosidase